MGKKGIGYPEEILMAVFFVIIVMAFYAKDYQNIVPPMIVLLGGVMALMGFVMREPMIVAGGIALLGFALMYTEVVLK